MAFIGKLVWNALGWAMPGLSASWLYLLAGSLGISLIASVAFFKGAEGKSAAVAAERSACVVSKAQDAQASAEAMAQLLATINAQDGGIDADKTAMQLCAGSPFCRDGGKK